MKLPHQRVVGMGQEATTEQTSGYLWEESGAQTSPPFMVGRGLVTSHCHASSAQQHDCVGSLLVANFPFREVHDTRGTVIHPLWCELLPCHHQLRSTRLIALPPRASFGLISMTGSWRDTCPELSIPWRSTSSGQNIEAVDNRVLIVATMSPSHQCFRHASRCSRNNWCRRSSQQRPV